MFGTKAETPECGIIIRKSTEKRLLKITRTGSLFFKTSQNNKRIYHNSLPLPFKTPSQTKPKITSDINVDKYNTMCEKSFIIQIEKLDTIV